MKLRVEFVDAARAIVIRVKGRIVGLFAEDLRSLVARCHVSMRIIVDLSQVSFIDSIGEDVLSWLGRLGVTFVADSAYALDTCERLRLQQLRRRSWAGRYKV